MKVPDPNLRRIHLGWEVSATPSDEGVRVFSGIWFNSESLQRLRDEKFFTGKVKVFVDPDDLNIATVVLPGHTDPIEVYLQMTVFADMTLGEVLQLMAEYRREDPAATEIYHDRLMEVKARRFAEISSIAVEHDLPRSYTTFEECKTLAKAVFAGARYIGSAMLPGTTAPHALTVLVPGAGVFAIGGGASVIEGVANATPVEAAREVTDPMGGPTGSDAHLPSTRPVEIAHPPMGEDKPARQSEKLVRPKNLKELK